VFERFAPFSPELETLMDGTLWRITSSPRPLRGWTNGEPDI
jgi:hypothetical protein